MERPSNHADRHRQNETWASSSDILSQSARNRSLIGLGQNPRQWSEQASTSRTSDSDQGKRPSLDEKQEKHDMVHPKDILLINNLKWAIIEKYKEKAGGTRQVLRTVHNKIGEHCLKYGKNEEALFSYEIARALDSDTGAQGYASAIRAFNAQLQSEKQVVQTGNSLSQIEQSIVEGYEKHLQSEEEADEIKSLLNNSGEQYREKGQHREALFFYNAALALDKRSKTALKGRGAIYREQGRLNEALTDLNKALELSIWPGPFTLSNRGATLQELGYPDKALIDLDKALKKEPGNLLALAHRGAAYRELGRPNNALPDLNKVLEQDPNNTFALAHRGAAYRGLGQPNNALPDLNKVLEQDPNNTLALAHRGATLRELGQPNNALPDLNKVLEQDPNNSFALAHRGATYRELGQLDKALPDLNKALERDPNNSFALAHRGATYQELGQLDKALPDLNKALERDPKNSFATETRAKVYQKRRG